MQVNINSTIEMHKSQPKKKQKKSYDKTIWIRAQCASCIELSKYACILKISFFKIHKDSIEW